MKNNIDYIGVLLLTVFFILLTYAGFLSYRSIDWNVLKRMESSPLVLPTPIPTQLPEPSLAPKI